MNLPANRNADTPQLVTVCTTVAHAEQARNMARQVVEQGLAACVHVTQIESIYRWDGAVQNGAEWQLACTTTAARSADLQQALLAQHPYTLPAVYSLPVGWAHAPYAQWVDASVIASV